MLTKGGNYFAGKQLQVRLHPARRKSRRNGKGIIVSQRHVCHVVANHCNTCIYIHYVKHAQLSEVRSVTDSGEEGHPCLFEPFCVTVQLIQYVLNRLVLGLFRIE